MVFENLPEDIIILILKQLDIISLYNFHTACNRVREIIRTYRIIKICDISLNILSSVNTFKLLFFKDISRHLQEINVSAITDLNKSSLLPVMNSLKCLKSLNVSYTNITLNDFVELYKKRKTIKCIVIDFKFGKFTMIKVKKEVLSQCQEVFKNLDDVHFVGNISNLVYSELPYFILSKSRLNNLQYTIVKCNTNTYESVICYERVVFNTFTIYIYDEKCSSKTQGDMNDMPLFNMLNYFDYEILVIWQMNMNLRAVYGTPAIEKVFKENFLDLELLYITDFDITLYGNAYVMLWNKNTTTFDENFHASLLKKMKPFFPYAFDTLSKNQLPLNYDWFHSHPEQPGRRNVCRPTPSPKRPRLVDPPYNLDYSEQFKLHNTIQLTLSTNTNINSLTLNTSNDYLRKLTYLSLSGHVHYTNDFFCVLFRCCDKLVTLNVEANAVCSCFRLISKYISSSRSLKNLRLLDRYINFDLLFPSLSECKSLENVHIIDKSSRLKLSDPSPLFEKCDQFYWLAIYGCLSEACCTKQLQIIKRAKFKCRKLHIRTNLFNMNIDYPYIPSLGVFQLNPLQPK